QRARCVPKMKLARWPQASAPTSSPQKPQTPFKPSPILWAKIIATKCLSMGRFLNNYPNPI
ncbi:MAG: hypothetical protein EBR94_07945, partial [Bacteroidetes bacterium]|nr:hypothetical protein [Bacteroidota bacterium]